MSGVRDICERIKKHRDDHQSFMIDLFDELYRSDRAVYDLALSVMVYKKSAAAWMYGEKTALGNISPYEALIDGRHDVIALLKRIDHGVYL